MTCCVCFEQYDESIHRPLVLSCYHSVCSSCAGSMGTRFLCPKCRAPQSGNSFPTNYAVLEMLEEMGPQNVIHREPSLLLRVPFGVDIAPPLLAQPISISEMRLLHRIRTFGYATVKLEDPPEGCELRHDVPRCFVTSYSESGIVVEVDLVEKGFPERTLDSDDLIAMISILVARRRDCPSQFTLRASLLRDGETAKNAACIRSTSREFPMSGGDCDYGKWTQVGLLFEQVPKGTRKIVVRLSGKAPRDTRFWPGICSYGSKFANLAIRVNRARRC